MTATKKVSLIVSTLIISVLVMLALVFFSQTKGGAKSSKPIVAVTTFALYDITKHIAGDTVKIVSIMPFGVDPHSYEPTPKLITQIEKSALVIYSGAGLEPWIHGFEFKSKVIDMSKNVSLQKLSAQEAEHDANEEEHEHHHHGAFDPHYWLSIENMITAANIITKELIGISPNHEELYMKNREG